MATSTLFKENKLENASEVLWNICFKTDFANFYGVDMLPL